MIGNRLTWNPDMGMLWLGGTTGLDGQLMTGPAFKPLDLEGMWPRCVKRGDNVVLPGVDGQLEREQDQDQLTVELSMQMAGGCQQSGAPWGDGANDIKGLRRNHKILVATCRPSSVVALLLDPDGDYYRGNVQPEISELGNEGGQIVRVTITLTIPRGELLEIEAP